MQCMRTTSCAGQVEMETIEQVHCAHTLKPGPCQLYSIILN